ncbi:MAG: Lipopolysaccharide export system permease protein LptG [Gammaproteobacteria bacterium]|nr:Lipopolysaccharide export system permease protein LptG [Gammaproteobacteria bacterium]
MRILDLYIGRVILYQTGVVLAVLVSLFMFITFIEQVGEVGTGRYGAINAIEFTILSVPRIIYEVFPMSALLGSILGLSSLAVSSELVVIRTAGVSIVRLMGSVLKVGAILALIAMLIGELLTPWSETEARRGRAEAMQEEISQQTDFGLWMRDHMTYVNVGEVLPDLSLLNVRIFEFDNEGRLRSLVYADHGGYRDQRWRLDGIEQTLINENRTGAESKDVKAAYWTTDVTPEILSVFMVRPDQLSAWQLSRYISHLRENNQDTGSYELSFWSKIMTPVATAVMVILAIPFVFSQMRTGGFGRNLFFGIMLGLAYFAFDKGFGYVVLVFDIPPLLGAMLPTLLFLAVGVVLLRRR